MYAYLTDNISGVNSLMKRSTFSGKYRTMVNKACAYEPG
jgi:hypothetical protein